MTDFKKPADADERILVGSKEYEEAIVELIANACTEMNKLILDREANMKARVLEEALSDVVREALGGNDMTPLDVMTALALLMTRSGLAIGGALVNCNHEDCARQKGIGIIAAICKVGIERGNVARRLPEGVQAERVTQPGKHGAH